MSTRLRSNPRDVDKKSKKRIDKWRIEKVNIPILVAILGCLGTSCVALISLVNNPFVSNILLAKSADNNAPQTQIEITPFPNPTGEKIFFLRGNDFRMMSLDRSYDRLIADYPQAPVVCPAISPDGERILFNSYIESFADLYSIDRDGKNLYNITNNEGFDEVCGGWSPDQKRILFYVQYSDENNDIFVIDSDGKHQERITDTYSDGIGVKNMVTETAWSPDGNKIVFSSNKDGDLEIYIFELGTNQAPIQVTNNTIDDYRASWSPDGTKIVYTSRISVDNPEIFVIDLSNATLPTAGINVTNNSKNDTDATWSPDSKRIAFISNRLGSEEIFIMDADGNNIEKLTNTLEAESKPRWIK